MTPELKAIEEQRGRVYGDPLTSHINIGLSWTALLQQHFGITLDHPIPPELVALMMVTFKAQRSCRVFQADNYDDLAVYADFARRFQGPQLPPESERFGDSLPAPYDNTR